MKIENLEDKKGKVNIDLLIIYDQTEVRSFGDKKVKPLICKDADAVMGEESPTVFFDLPEEYFDKFKHLEKIRITDGYSTLIPGKNQFRIKYPKKVEKIED